MSPFCLPLAGCLRDYLKEGKDGKLLHPMVIFPPETGLICPVKMRQWNEKEYQVFPRSWLGLNKVCPTTQVPLTLGNFC